MRRGTCWLLGVFGALGMAGEARAQQPSSATQAEALFQQGCQRMAEGKVAEACPTLAASQKLNPEPGTLLNLAACYERNGQSASTWATWLQAAAAAQREGRTDGVDQSKARAEQLAPTLSRLILVIPPSSDVAGLSIEPDGLTVPREQWGEPVPADPGVHPVLASAPERTMWTTTVTVGPNAAAVTVTVPALAKEPVPTPAATIPLPAVAPASRQASEPDRIAERPPPMWKTVGLVMGGVGLAGMAVGSVFGLMAKSSHDDAMDRCANQLCTQQGLDAEDRAHDQAAASSIAFVSGLLLLGSGTALYFLTPAEQGEHGAHLQVRAQLGAGAVRVGGAW